MSGRLSSDHARSDSRSSQPPRLSQGQHESLPRHSFGRTSRVSNPNVFSDEYSLDPVDPDEIDRAPSPDSISSSTTLRSVNQTQKNTSNATTTAEPENPFADHVGTSFEEPHRSSLPQKGGGFATERNSVSSIHNTQFAGQRNQSISSRFSTPRAMSPYTGATGPSHPYAMYPQIGVSRTPSVGSTSTIRPAERPLGELNGPQHPYAMYTQNVVEEGIDDDQIPVGFPGHTMAYQSVPDRRIDDVGDIIGPDGHTEPLPPYSRYPTGVVPKPPGTEETLTNASPSPQGDQRRQSVSRDGVPIPPVPVSETSSRALVPDNTGDSERDPDGGEAAPATGIMAFEEKLKQKGKQTACCGLPVWTLVLVVTVMLIGGSIGGAIGGVLGTRKAQEAEHQAEAASHKPGGPPIVTVTATPQLDYSSMTSTPTNMKTAPTGSYLIPSVLKNISRFCVDNRDMKQVWSCMEKPSDFAIDIKELDGKKAVVFKSDTPTLSYTYGAQQPLLPSPTQYLQMAIDTSEASLGPALFFFALFNKLVILPEDTLSSSSVSRRDLNEREFDPFSDPFAERKMYAKTGEKPWFCWWNSTMMEFFLYVNQSTIDESSDSMTAATGGDLAASTATAQPNARRSQSTPDYPRKIKIEERRDYAAAESPYCQQMEIGQDGHLEPIKDSVIHIKESEPTPTTTYIPTALGADQTYTARAQYATPCYCLSSAD